MRIPYDAVIFDLDGTLTRSDPGITKSVQYALSALGYPECDQQTLKSFIGPPLFESFKQKIGLDDQTARAAISIFRDRYAQVGWMDNAVYTGVPLLLRSLKARGAYIAVATSKSDLFADKIIDYFALRAHIDRVIATKPGTEHSDKPDLVRRALPKSFERACMVGDRKFDVEGALANNIDAIGVLYGYGDRDELTRAGAHGIAEDVPGLTRLLLGGIPPEKGLFISLEGSDGCGKTTQIGGLSDWLSQLGHDVALTREPGGCPVSERIRELLLDASAHGMTDLTEALLFAASRAQHVHDVIRPALDAGKTVLCDRYVDSSIAYQGVGRGLGVEWIQALNAPAVRDTMPDLTLVFDVDPESALSRRVCGGEPDRIEVVAPDFIEKTYAYYQSLVSSSPDRVKCFDANGTPDQVAQNLRRFLVRFL